MNPIQLEDDFGRRTTATAEIILEDGTDTQGGLKPQWLEIAVWRTEGGNFIVRRVSCYRVNHSSASCRRAEGYTIVEADDTDTYPCSTCGGGGYAQESRVSIDSYTNTSELIKSFCQDGRYSNFARSVLANLSEVDASIAESWNVVHVL